MPVRVLTSKTTVVHIDLRGEAPFVAAKYASEMTPAYDLKPVEHYGVDQVIIKGKGLSLGTVNRKEAVTFSGSSGDTLVWHIHVGIAGRYDLRIRYCNNTQDTLGTSLVLLSGDGRVMERDAMHFTPTENKWRNSNLMMATSINAGDYKLYLYSRSAKGLHISGLDVQ